MNDDNIGVADGILLDRVREGDPSAYGELWVRHRRAIVAVARSTPWVDPDDLVSETFARVLASIHRGNGPAGAFRPYALVTARSVIVDWARRRKDDAVDPIEFDIASDALLPDETLEHQLQRTVTARVFAALPSRWQEILWYSEVEGLRSTEIARLLGMSANAVGVLAFRAREGFRQAWITEHISATPAVSAECTWVTGRIPKHVRGKLASTETSRLEAHAGECNRCAILIEEASHIERRAGLVLLPLILGPMSGAYLAAADRGQTGPEPATAGGVASTPSASGFAPAVAAAGRQRVPGGSDPSTTRSPVTPAETPPAIPASAPRRVALAVAAAGVVVALVLAVTAVLALGGGSPPTAQVAAVDPASALSIARDLGSGTAPRSPSPAPDLLRAPTPAPTPLSPAPAEPIPPKGANAPPTEAPAAPAPGPPPAPMVEVKSGAVSFPFIFGQGVAGATVTVELDLGGTIASQVFIVDADGHFGGPIIVESAPSGWFDVQARQTVDGLDSAWTSMSTVWMPAAPTGTWVVSGPSKIEVIVFGPAGAAFEVLIDDLVVSSGTLDVSGKAADLIAVGVIPTQVQARFVEGAGVSPVGGLMSI